MGEAAAVYFEDHKESSDLGRLAVRGGIVSVAMQYGNGILQLAAAIVLARLLAPEDFGLFAIVTVLTSFAPFLIDFGLGDATAQKSKITQSQVSSLFWLSSGIGLALAVVVASCSPLIAWVFGEPRLEAIAIYSAITFVLLGLANQHLALLRRTMQFATIAKIQFLGTLAGIAIAVIFAIRGYGYWALVLRPIVSSLCIAIGAWLLCRWRPGFPVLDSEVKSMVRFGLHVVSFSITYILAKSVDRIALGLFYPTKLVGYYQNATTLYDKLNLHDDGSVAHGRKRGPQQTSIKSCCSSAEIRSGIVFSGVFLHASGGDPVGDGRRPGGHPVGRKVATCRFPPQHNCFAWYFPNC